MNSVNVNTKPFHPLLLLLLQKPLKLSSDKQKITPVYCSATPTGTWP